MTITHLDLGRAVGTEVEVDTEVEADIGDVAGPVLGVEVEIDLHLGASTRGLEDPHHILLP